MINHHIHVSTSTSYINPMRTLSKYHCFMVNSQVSHYFHRFSHDFPVIVQWYSDQRYDINSRLQLAPFDFSRKSISTGYFYITPHRTNSCKPRNNMKLRGKQHGTTKTTILEISSDIFFGLYIYYNLIIKPGTMDHVDCVPKIIHDMIIHGSLHGDNDRKFESRDSLSQRKK